MLDMQKSQTFGESDCLAALIAFKFSNLDRDNDVEWQHRMTINASKVTLQIFVDQCGSLNYSYIFCFQSVKGRQKIIIDMLKILMLGFVISDETNSNRSQKC